MWLELTALAASIASAMTGAIKSKKNVEQEERNILRDKAENRTTASAERGNNEKAQEASLETNSQQMNEAYNRGDNKNVAGNMTAAQANANKDSVAKAVTQANRSAIEKNAESDNRITARELVNEMGLDKQQRDLDAQSAKNALTLGANVASAATQALGTMAGTQAGAKEAGDTITSTAVEEGLANNIEPTKLDVPEITQPSNTPLGESTKTATATDRDYGVAGLKKDDLSNIPVDDSREYDTNGQAKVNEINENYQNNLAGDETNGAIQKRRAKLKLGYGF